MRALEEPMSVSEVPERLRVRRKPERADYGRDRLDEIVDEALFCHAGVVRDGWPVVLCMAHGRDVDTLYLHGSAAAGVFRDMRRGTKVCVAMTLLDGLVLARSARSHSMNYRSAVILGEASAVADPDEKRHGLRVVVEHSLQGRWDALRPPTAEEIAETGLWALPLTSASCKVRSGPPLDPAADAAWPVWAGVVPVQTLFGAPEPAPGLADGVLPGPDVLSLAARRPKS